MTAEEDNPTGPQTPRRTPAKAKTPDATPKEKASTATTPKSAPAAGAPRRRSATNRSQPTLLGDFLLGRQTPARVAADRERWRQKQMTLEQVKKEMRESAVRKVQAPGGVHDRVKQWQKKNAAALAEADPLAAPSEPSEIHVQVDEKSVTEEDRVRIKKGIKPKPSPKVIVVESTPSGDETEGKTRTDSKSPSPPKKRVVSDTNWMKNNSRSPPRSRSPPKTKKPGNASNSGSPIPKSFSPRTAPNPTVKNKIKDWATRVEPPDEPHVKRYNVSRSVGSGDGTPVSATVSRGDDSSARSGSRSRAQSEDCEIIVETHTPRRPRTAGDDGIRVTPTRKRSGNNDGIRVTPSASTVPDDGIRVTPSTSTVPDDGIRVTPSTSTVPDDGIRVTPTTSTLPDDGIRVYSGDPKAAESSSTLRATSRRGSARVRSAHRETEDDNTIEVIEDPESDVPDTPTRRSSRRKSSRLSSKLTQQTEDKSHADTGTTMTEDVSDSESWTSGSGGSELDSDIPSSMPSKLAEIPVGYSAFSELNLPVKGSSGRPKTKRNSSFKGATNVLKKAFVESKKILSERADPPPKPVANQPRSIESWLNKTVDPFVENSDTSAADSPESKRKSVEKDWAGEHKARRSTSGSKQSPSVEPPSELTATDNEESTITFDEQHRQPVDTPKTEKAEEGDDTAPSTGGLRRSRAVRSLSSPLKPTAKKGFKERLKEAFRGESSLEYANSAEDPRRDAEYDHDDEHDRRERRRSSGNKSPPSSHPSSQDDDSSITSPEQTKVASGSACPKRRPPTNGFHELSTIISLESMSNTESELSSVLSDTTITQTTGLTGTTGSGLSRHRSNKPGLKRRLTKHSDLVSVLSLPDEPTKVGRSKSLRATRSLRRTSSHLESATVDGLLREFIHDEDLYQRELKTLVDGVIPVLLNQYVTGNGALADDLFSSSSKGKDNGVTKSVVQMGIALEKIRNAHKRCPMTDAHKLPQWLETAVSIYDSYLDVWRLGFNDLIVNLAPLSLDDNDSLIDALPRNEQGDVVNEDGERVDVAHLLKRPLVRAKWITRFIRGYRTITGTDQYHDLAAKWEKLQEKARRRYKEESARIVDEDAVNTDTTRVRDIKTLEVLDSVKIDRFRQVFAKDLFSLDLRHSNGQRLECRVELVSRDNQLFKSDPGDLLIRETGSGGRSWLLFAPITGGNYSARKGNKKGQLVVMIRDKHQEWFELLTLTTGNEEQVLDWLDILGTSPVPPAIAQAEPAQSMARSKCTLEDAPLGERTRQRRTSSLNSPTRAGLSPELQTEAPTRSHQRDTSSPTTPRSASSEKTATPDTHGQPRARHASETSSPSKDDGRSRPLREYMRPDPVALQNPPTGSSPNPEDGGPPPTPPAHRIMPNKKSSLSPPVDLTPTRVKRRGSSPLKHEYHPSDVSSEGTVSSSDESGDDEDDSTDDSSDDELEAVDIPDTMPAISIKKSHEDFVTDSVLSDTTISLTPSASASQAGIPKIGGQTPAYAFKSTASISYWDNKRGCWKDLWPDNCSIITTPGLIEAYPSKGSSAASHDEERPLIALDLTPLVMLRNSTVLDLEIRSPVLSYARLYSKVMKIETCFFRFRAANFQECEQLYLAVHRARMDNAKFKALEEEARIRSFGQNQAPEQDGDSSSRRRGWFGRKNSYRVSARAPSQSAGSNSHASTASASSFLKRLMGGGNQSFNIAMSSVDKYRGSSAEASLYASSTSSGMSPRSPSVSAAHSGNQKMSLTTNNLKIRLHLLISASKWEDNGNCLLEITRPPSGARQNLRKYQGMEKRIIVTTIPKRSNDPSKAVVVLDVVLGSRCFSRLGSRGILLNVWEEVRDESGEMGVAPKGGGSGGNVNKWCFQCASVAEASWIYGLVTQEVMIS